ncbi:adenosylcobinamide amidohydrolase [Yinghuangia sp. YIM S09857]|uniref:adenosylcobinamide amidohydrolase n=1 Tax=Yinghuangia sp. YIM S09857 TaxID=3436929 RepID=UPI003F52CCEB
MDAAVGTGPELVRHGGLPALLWRAGPGWRMVSSAILGGGLGPRAWVLNMQVPPGYSRMDPVAHLAEAAAAEDLAAHDGVGLMTAADVAAFTTGEDHGVRAWVTTGIGIPAWAAAPEPAAQPSDLPGPAPDRDAPPNAAYPPPGTINTIVVIPVPLTDAALVNAVATATEAKVQALVENGYACTGTPSDAVCVAARTPRPGEVPELFGGPRSLWGSRLARAVHAAVAQGARDDRVRRDRVRPGPPEGSSWSP